MDVTNHSVILWTFHDYKSIWGIHRVPFVDNNDRELDSSGLRLLRQKSE